MSDQFFWFATRSAGIIAWFAASGSLLVGLLLSTRALGRRPTIPWLLDLHRFLGAMSVVLLGVHLFTLWADSFVSFGPAELFVPGVATVPGLSRLSLALGVIAGWFLVIIEASSLIRTHLPERFWHTLHLTSFGVVAAGSIHALETGSDTDNRYLIAIVASLLMAILLLSMIRLFAVLFDRKRRYEEAMADDDWDDEAYVEPDLDEVPAYQVAHDDYGWTDDEHGEYGDDDHHPATDLPPRRSVPDYDRPDSSDRHPSTTNGHQGVRDDVILGPSRSRVIGPGPGRWFDAEHKPISRDTDDPEGR